MSPSAARVVKPAACKVTPLRELVDLMGSTKIEGLRGARLVSETERVEHVRESRVALKGK